MAAQDKQPSTVEQTVSQFLDAGIGLAMLPFSLAQQSFASTKEETASKLAALQARGEELDAQLRSQLNPAKFCGQMLQAFSPKASREAKIDELSAKVDTLVELVATLAAKQAAEKAAASETKSAESKPAPRKRTTRSAATKAPAKPRATKTSGTAKTTSATPKKDA